MTFSKVTLDDGGLALGRAQVPADAVHQLLFVPRSPAAERVALHVLVQEFVRVQLGTVARQEKHLDLCGVCGQPATHRRRTMHGMTVDDQEDALLDLPDEALEESQDSRPGSP